MSIKKDLEKGIKIYNSDKNAILKALILRNFKAFSIMTFSVMIANIIDGVIIGQFIGSEAMAAFGLFKPVTIIAFAIASVIAVSFQTVSAQVLGEGKKRETENLFSMCIWFTLFVSTLLTILGVIAKDPIVSVLGAKGGLAGITGDYAVGYFLGLPAYIIQVILYRFARLEGRQKLITVSVSVMTVADIAGDLISVLCFGNSLFGIGLATSIGYYVSLLVFISVFFEKSTLMKFHISHLPWKSLFNILSYGIPAAVNKICKIICCYGMNLLLLSHFGSQGVAVYSIFNTWFDFACIAQTGMSSTVQIIAGVIYGEKDERSMRRLMWTGIGNMLLINTVISTVTIIFAPYITRMFLRGSETDVIAMCVVAFRIMITGIIPMSVSDTFGSYFQGIGDKTMSNITSFFAEFGCKLPVAWLLSLLPLKNGIWLSMLLGQLLIQLVIYIMKCIKKTNILFLPDNFAVDAKDVCELNVFGMDDVVKASVAAEEFCNSHDLDDRHKMLIALCIEEMTRNIVAYGFNDNKKHHIDIRLVHHDTGINMRIRDDCEHFDPSAWVGDRRTEDPTRNIGIRMIFNLTDHISYIPLLGFNTLLLMNV